MKGDRSLKDQMGRTVVLPNKIERIVSLVPSQSELIVELGAEEKLVGITRFCIHPKRTFKSISRVGGTKDFKLERIAALKPDLIIGNKEENQIDGILELEKQYPVWMSDIKDLPDAYEMISVIGSILEKQSEAETMLNQIKASFSSLPQISKSAIYLIWAKPYMAAGQGSFINHLLEQIGITNCVSKERYPSLDLDEIIAHQPELILLSSEPFPFKDVHKSELQAVLPNTQILLVDGELFSWYGSRLLHSAKYFEELSACIL